MSEQPLSPAGWQPDPERPDTWRYWDGQAWTEERAPMTAADSRAAEAPSRAIGPVAGAAMVILVVLVLGSAYNEQFAFAALWLAILGGVVYFVRRR